VNAKVMVDSGAIKKKISALEELGVGEFAHLNGDLESHLLGTYALLMEWGNPEYICDAGLYHAVYGTQPMKKLGIPHREYSPSDRPRIREVIGEESERLVYLYGACDREYFYPRIGSGAPGAIYRDRFSGATLELPSRTLQDILEITMANELEICLSGPLTKENSRNFLVELFSRFNGLVSMKAFTRFQDEFQV
jgi:hypothetical protein